MIHTKAAVKQKIYYLYRDNITIIYAHNNKFINC